MNYYIDTEFHEGFNKPLFGKKRHFIDFISIGIVAEDGREYYAISKDFDVEAAWNAWQPRKGQGDRNNHEPKEYWLRENVLLPIFKGFYPDNLGNLHHYPTFNYSNMKSLIRSLGKSDKTIANEIINFITSCEDTPFISKSNIWSNADIYEKTKEFKSKIDFYGYYADYDWVLFCSLFGKMMDLPKGFPMYCIDLKQTFDDICLRKCNGNNGWVNDFQLATKGQSNYPKETNAHNALADAKWNKQLHDFLLKINQA